METNIISVHTLDDQEDIANIFRKYDLLAIPVVDKEGRLVGIITIDDIVDIIEQENTEDFQRMAAMQPSDEEYLKTSVVELAKHRDLAAYIDVIGYPDRSIIQKYQDVLYSVAILTSFILMLMDTAGTPVPIRYL